MPSKMFRKYSHFVLCVAFFQTKYCYSPKFKYLALPKFLGWLINWAELVIELARESAAVKRLFCISVALNCLMVISNCTVG